MGAMTKFDISSNEIRAEGGKALAAGLKGNQVITELNISSNNLGLNSAGNGDISGVITIANVISDMGALSSLNISSNNLTSRQSAKKEDCTGLSFNTGDTVQYQGIEYTVTGCPGNLAYITVVCLAGVIALANAIPDMGALSVLSLKKNNLCTKEAGKALGEMLKVNSVLKELDVSSNNWMGGHYLDDSQGDGSGFAQELAVGIKDNGAISSINLLKNHIPIKQARELVQIMQAKEKLITLCGLSKEEAELDFTGQDLRAGDAVLIANDISDMRAMTSLSLASNSLGVEGAKIIAAVFPKCT
jgi:hypothetical protein